MKFEMNWNQPIKFSVQTLFDVCMQVTRNIESFVSLETEEEEEEEEYQWDINVQEMLK